MCVCVCAETKKNETNVSAMVDAVLGEVRMLCVVCVV